MNANIVIIIIARRVYYYYARARFVVWIRCQQKCSEGSFKSQKGQNVLALFRFAASSYTRLSKLFITILNEGLGFTYYLDSSRKVYTVVVQKIDIFIILI